MLSFGPPSDEEKLLLEIGNALNEPATVQIVENYKKKNTIKIDFPDNWHIWIDTPVTDLLGNEQEVNRFISMTLHIRANQLKDKIYKVHET
jgi:hypothetical protein